MVHADASNFDDGLSKEEVYRQLLLQAAGLFEGQRNWVCNLANTASLLWHAYKSLPPPSNAVNWAGFYVVERTGPSKSELVLGPFQGKVACQRIAFGRGVCGAAAETRKTQLVSDVREYPGHISCDADSRSEVVVPIMIDSGDESSSRQLVGIIDIDCGVTNGFDAVDTSYLEELAGLLARACDWQLLDLSRNAQPL